MNEHDAYHQQEETQRRNNSNVRHGERATQAIDQLVSKPVATESAHTSCRGCRNDGSGCKTCFPWHEKMELIERKNYAP